MGSSLDSSATGDLPDMGTVLVAAILILGRMWMDIFILAVNCRDWMNKKCLTLTDRILTLQASFRICLGCLAMTWSILTKYYPSIAEIDLVSKVFTFILWYFTVCNLWLTASLCSYYCVKIADFSHPFFIHLKVSLSRLVSTWLFGSLVLSLASSLPYVWSDFELWRTGNISNVLINENTSDINQASTASYGLALLGLGCFAALSICATSALLLLFSLWRHHQRMLSSLDGNRSPQTNAHFKAVIIILSHLISNIFAFLSILVFLSSGLPRSAIPNLVAECVLCICFLLESFISMWGNRKLKNELCRALYFANCSRSGSRQ